MGLVKARGKQRTDSTHILAVVRGLNRLELVGETMRHTLDVLSTVAPAMVAPAHVRPEWVERYVRRLDEHRLPKGKEVRRAEAESIGNDGYELLDTVLFERCTMLAARGSGGTDAAASVGAELCSRAGR